MWFLISAFAGTPTLAEVPDAARPPMIVGEALCLTTLTHDATGAITGVDIDAECPPLFAASVKPAAEDVTFESVDAAGSFILEYRFGEDGDGRALVSRDSSPVLGLSYRLKVLKRGLPKYPKRVEVTDDVTCVVELKIDAEGLGTELKISDCPEAFHGEVESAMKKWRWEPVAHPPEGGVPTKIKIKFIKH